jgi:hypothetical protein
MGCDGFVAILSKTLNFFRKEDLVDKSEGTWAMAKPFCLNSGSKSTTVDAK